MAADLTTVTKQVTDILNLQAAGTFSSTIAATNLDRHADGITEAVRKGALMVAQAITANPNHVHRNLFVSSSTALTHGAELPDMAGETDLIEIQPYSGADYQTGVMRDVQQIESYRSNPSSIYDSIAHNITGSRLGGYYAVANGRIYFTGYAARGYFPAVSRSTVTSLIPDEYEPVWTAASVGFTRKEGDNLDPVINHYWQYALSMMPVITSMGVIQPLPASDSARRNRGN